MIRLRSESDFALSHVRMYGIVSEVKMFGYLVLRVLSKRLFPLFVEGCLALCNLNSYYWSNSFMNIQKNIYIVEIISSCVLLINITGPLY